jgi:hypothetical protein
MRLEGSLDAFSLPDVFQLLSNTKKTGGLHLTSDGSDGVVYFDGGQVTGASADCSRQPLARRLVGSGAVTDDALSGAVSAAEGTESLGVVRALLDHGSVDPDLLRQAAKDQAVDAVFDLLRWRTGDFSFALDEINPDDVGVKLPAEKVLTDADGRNATWETVSKVVPSPQAVLAMPVVLPSEPAVSREEWSLLALVDGRRTVADLVDLTGSGQYAVVSTLAGLVQRGLLEVRPPAGEPGAEEADHVAVVVRRQQLLAPLESAEATEAAAPAAAAPAAPSVPRSRGDAGGGEVSDAVADHGAPASSDNSPSDHEPELVHASLGHDQRSAHGAQLPSRPDSAGDSNGSPTGSALSGVLTTATAPNLEHSVIERDPEVNRSLMLRLIAGVRGL